MNEQKPEAVASTDELGRVPTWRERLLAAVKEYDGVRCMCVLTGCRAGPGCPHYCDHCKHHIAHVQRTA